MFLVYLCLFVSDGTYGEKMWMHVVFPFLFTENRLKHIIISYISNIYGSLYPRCVMLMKWSVIITITFITGAMMKIPIMAVFIFTSIINYFWRCIKRYRYHYCHYLPLSGYYDHQYRFDHQYHQYFWNISTQFHF